MYVCQPFARSNANSISHKKPVMKSDMIDLQGAIALPLLVIEQQRTARLRLASFDPLWWHMARKFASGCQIKRDPLSASKGSNLAFSCSTASNVMVLILLRFSGSRSTGQYDKCNILKDILAA